MKFKRRTLEEIADMICGNFPEETSHFQYRSSSYLTDFFRDADTDFTHDGSTRKWWVQGVLEQILSDPQSNPLSPPDSFLRVIQTLMDQGDSKNDDSARSQALAMINGSLAREGFEAFYGEDRNCYLRHIASNTVATANPNPHRPFTSEEVEKRNTLAAYLDNISEDDLIEQILLPLFRTSRLS